MLNYGTALAVRAYALSRDWSELPPPQDKEAVKEAVDAFLATLHDYTEEQVFAALEYVESGITETEGEYGTPPKKDGSEDELEDWGFCISLGVLNKARAVLWGVTEAEAKGMTRQQLEDVMEL